MISTQEKYVNSLLLYKVRHQLSFLLKREKNCNRSDQTDTKGK